MKEISKALNQVVYMMKEERRPKEESTDAATLPTHRPSG